MSERFVPERSGSVPDTKTGLREWFNSHREAIDAARAKNTGWQASDGEIRMVAAYDPKACDDLIARLVARDNLKAE